MIRVAVAGAAGRMGETVCRAVKGADGMELVARIDPHLGLELDAALAQHKPDVMVEFSVPSTAVANIKAAVAAGVHVVVGTSGFDHAEVADLTGANVFIAPNFAIGAVLMMKFAAEAYRHLDKAEVIELHHDRKLDKPSGTAAHTARVMAAAAGKEEPPIHSVRLPGMVANQEVILGAIGQTLTIRHDTIDRSSFMPGVLLAVRKVAALTDPLTVGLDQLL